MLRNSLDGKNLEVVLLEFGVRLHRVIYEHIQLFTISEGGAMIIICDMNEYRKVIKEFKVFIISVQSYVFSNLPGILLIKYPQAQ